MKRNIGLCMVLAFLIAAAATVVAQDYSMSPPKVLLVQREFLRPGVSGAPHAKTESAFVQARQPQMADSATWDGLDVSVRRLSGGFCWECGESDNLATQERHACGSS